MKYLHILLTILAFCYLGNNIDIREEPGMQIAVEVDGSANVKEIAEKTGLTYEGPSFHPQIHLFRMNSEMSKREDHTRTIQVLRSLPEVRWAEVQVPRGFEKRGGV